MAKVFSNSVFFGASGKIGSVTFVTNSGGTYIRKASRNKSNSAYQTHYRGKFRFASGLLKEVRAVLKMGFAGTGNWYASGMKHLLAEALETSGTGFSINYARLQLSEGKIKAPLNAVAVVLERGIEFGWDCSEKDKNKHKTEAVAVAYFQESDVWSFERIEKSKKKLLLRFPSDQEASAQCFLFFYDEGRQMASSTVYLGESKRVEERKVPEC